MAKTTKPALQLASAKASPLGRLKQRVLKRIKQRNFAKSYLAVAIVIAAITAVYWSVLASRVHQTNADQIVDPYLFSDWKTFHGASFPGAHTFLLKWPLFALIGIIGTSATTLLVATVALSVVTVGSIVWLIYRIERRPLVAGTLILALVSALTLVPAAPYAGGILPVNIAMLATRNIEYIFYVAGLWFVIRSQRVIAGNYLFGIFVMMLLFASDKLFLSLSLGASLVGLVVYSLAQNWRVVTLFSRWLLATVIASMLALLLLALINATGFTHIAGESTTNPYGITSDAKTAALAANYALLGLLTNFGANPAYDATQVATIPWHFVHNMLTAAGPAYIVNIAIAVVALAAIWHVGRASLSKQRPKTFVLDSAFDVALLLAWSALAACGLFIVSRHYFAVDARYLTMVLFAGFTSLTVYSRKRSWRSQWLVGAGALLIVAIMCGVVGAWGTYHKQQQALQPYSERNATIAQVLSRHHVDTVVGDYWRVLPLKLASRNSLSITPLSSCTTPRASLTSQKWNTDLHRRSFAYILSLDKSLTDFPGCKIGQITAAYGEPNAMVLIAGDANNPKELLLFYDRGIRAHKGGPLPQVVSSVTPATLGDVRNVTCDGPTTLTIVAHQDDDLLFMNPDQMHDIQQGHCVRTVYLTAGDGGRDKYYWLSREQGSEAAYDHMLRIKKGWLQQTVRLPGGQYMSVASPLASSKISLIFLHLPDGNLVGEGFAGSHFESLEHVLNNVQPVIHSVDGQSSYTSAQLVDTLRTIMQLYKPSQIRTQATVSSTDFPDHSDHMAASRFAQLAFRQYEQTQYNNEVATPLLHYIGYPVRDMPANVSGDDLAQKQSAFFAYARFDGAVCYSVRDCSQTPTYWDYLARQYAQE